jgi:hypothetical protein
VVLDDGIMGAVHEADEGHGWERVAHAFDRVTHDHAFDVVRGRFASPGTLRDSVLS